MVKMHAERARSILRKVIEVIKQIAEVRPVRIGVQLVIVAISLIYLYKIYNSIPDYSLSLKPWPIALTFVGSIVSMFLGTYTWGLTLKAIGHKIPWIDVAGIQLKSNLAKYLPGYGWQLVGKTYLTAKSGLAVKNATLALIIELIVLYLYGVAFALIIIPDNLVTLFGGPVLDSTWYTLIRLLGIGIAALTPAALIKVVEWKFSRFVEGVIDKRAIYLLSGVMLIAWIFMGACFSLMASAFSEISIEMSLSFTFALIASYLVGFLVFIIPGSFGVREGIITFFLSPILGGPVAVSVAVVYRIITILGELSSLVIYLGLKTVLHPIVASNS